MNLMGLRVRTLHRMGTAPGDTFFTPEIVNDAVNQAVDIVEEEAYWPWTEAVLTGPLDPDGSIVLPDDWRATKHVFLHQDELALSDVADVLAWPDSFTGRPWVYAVVSNAYVVVRPLPDGIYDYTLVYYRTTPLLVDDIDQPLIPDRFTNVVVAKAAELLSIREDDRTGQASHTTEYNAALARMRKAMRPSTGPVAIRVRPGGWV